MPRLRTRHFAIACILSLPGAVGQDPRHFDLKAAQASRGTSGGDWLVLKLQSLVDTGFRLACGQLESLRPLGLHLLQVSHASACQHCKVTCCRHCTAMPIHMRAYLWCFVNSAVLSPTLSCTKCCMASGAVNMNSCLPWLVED